MVFSGDIVEPNMLIQKLTTPDRGLTSCRILSTLLGKQNLIVPTDPYCAGLTFRLLKQICEYFQPIFQQDELLV